MTKGPLGVLSTLLAVCQGTSIGDRIFGVVIALLGLGLWIGLVWLTVGLGRDTEERKVLVAILGVSALAGGIFIVAAHLDLEKLILLSLGLAVVVGTVGALLSRRVGLLPGIAAAIVGDLSLPLGVMLSLFLYASLGSGCLGEELG